MQDGVLDEPNVTNVLVWPGVWAIASTALIVGISRVVSFNRLDESGNLLLGAASGCLISTWILAATWIGLSDPPNTNQIGRSKFATRLMSAIPWVANFIVLIAATWYDRSSETQPILTLLILTTAIAIAGPIIIWQWSRQRIHRGNPLPRQSLSIRQILGIVVTVALATGALRMGQRGFGITSAATVLTVSVALNWVSLLVTVLGKKWWLIFFLVFSFVAEGLFISSMVDLRETTADKQLAYFIALLTSSFCFSFIFLLQVRADGYRWLYASLQHESSG